MTEGAEEGDLGAKNVASSIFRLVQMASVLKLTYNCVIITSEKMSRNPNFLQGKTTEYAQDSETMKNKSSQNVLLTTSQKHPVLAFSATFKRTTETPHQETTAPVHLGSWSGCPQP